MVALIKVPKDDEQCVTVFVSACPAAVFAILYA